MRLALALLLVFVGAALSCSTATPCSGCVDATGRCQPGAALQACGRGGAACVDCVLRHSACFDGVCVLAPDGGGAGGGAGGGGAGGGGGSTGCAGCVDAQGVCHPGNAESACGVDGGLCGDCTVMGSSCSPARVCAARLYADGGSRSRFWDGGACVTKTDCPCFSSDDCGPTFTCHSEDDTGLHVYCVPGARGDGGVGAPCVGEADCESALCTDSSSAGKRCSALCDVAAECPTSLPRCTYIGFGIERSICAP
ncbi:MAG: hypothetical protein ACOZQL_00550 [Myxococcota bacterium]